MTAIGNTASITLLTGLPGSGKTLRVVHYIKQAIDQGEVVFVSNLNGLKLPHVPFEDPREWRDLPPGSVLVVDEAQRFFRARRGGDPPQYITDMETIRHEGVRLILTTQQPDYLDTWLRGLVGLHEHLVREGGKPEVKIYRHNEVMDNVRSKRARATYDSETWRYPSDLFELYESAQVHTVKRVMSARTKRGLVMAALTLCLIVGAVVAFQRSRSVDDDAMHASSAPPARARPSAHEPVERKKDMTEKLTATAKHAPAAIEEYVANMRPRVPALPWSAPIYDDRPAVAEPRVFCMTSGAGLDAQGQHGEGGYTCITEQGTRVMMPADGYAQQLARWGEPYNPFRRPSQPQAAASQAEPVAVLAGPDLGRDPEPRGSIGTTASRPLVDASFGTITRPAL